MESLVASVLTYTKDLLVVLAAAGIGVKFTIDLKKSRNGGGVVTYKELAKSQKTCVGDVHSQIESVHNKVNEYHNTVLTNFGKHAERISSVETFCDLYLKSLSGLKRRD